MSLRRHLRFGRKAAPTAPLEASFRIAPWSKGIIQGFVVEMDVEGSWFPIGQVHHDPQAAETALAKILADHF